MIMKIADDFVYDIIVKNVIVFSCNKTIVRLVRNSQRHSVLEFVYRPVMRPIYDSLQKTIESKVMN